VAITVQHLISSRSHPLVGSTDGLALLPLLSLLALVHLLLLLLATLLIGTLPVKSSTDITPAALHLGGPRRRELRVRNMLCGRKSQT
jgi:hypothetical protein